MRNTFKLAYSYLKYYKKQTAALFLGMVMAVSLVTGIGSLLYSGRMANMERVREIYGDWHFQIRTDMETIRQIQENPKGKGYELERSGLLTVYEAFEDPYEITFCHGDETYMDMMGRTLKSGTLPQKPDEVALDTYTIRNLNLPDEPGSEVTINGQSYTLCGIVENQWDADVGDMKVFVSPRDEDALGNLLYVRFSEKRKTLVQMKALAGQYQISMNTGVARNNELAGYTGGDSIVGVPGIVKTGLSLPEGRFTFIWSGLDEIMNLTDKVILGALAVFGAFVIYSLFQVSVIRRFSQYSVMQTLGMGEVHTFAVLLCELLMIFIVGCPAGVLLGNGAARLLYGSVGKIFINQNIGTMQGGVHFQNAQAAAANIRTEPGMFRVSFGAALGCGIFMLVLLILFSWILVRRMRRLTWTQMIGKDSGRKRRDRRIYSQQRENLIGVLTKKFMFDRMGVFLGIIVSLSVGSIIFLGTTYVTENTKIHNELTFKADDGLGSDIQVYEDSYSLSDTIPKACVEEIRSLPEIAEADPVKYLLGEIPLNNGIFKWSAYFPETANEEVFEQSPDIMERYHGIVTQTGEDDYRMKTNVYGYSDRMLLGLEAYLLEGTISPEEMKKENKVILKTLVDGQGYYDGIDLKPGDTITLKVPANGEVPEEALRFAGPGEWYQEKEFEIAALVSRPLAKNNLYIGDNGQTTVGIIMSNGQMQENFGVEGYNNLSITLNKDVDAAGAADKVRNCVAGVNKCVVKDYTPMIQQQNLFLKQKMLFFYGIALVLLAVSLLHIMNSLQYLMVSRKHEFGILRAMGITDSGFRRMLVKEGVRYGVYSGVVMIAGYVLVRRFLYYLMVHSYRYLHPDYQLPVLFVLGMAAVNILLCIAAVMIAGQEVLKDNIIKEIRG